MWKEDFKVIRLMRKGADPNYPIDEKIITTNKEFILKVAENIKEYMVKKSSYDDNW